MGNSCTHPLDAVAHLVTEAEIQEAVRSIEEWQKAQAQAFKTGTSTATNAGPLLQRVGGLDVVKKVVELFYRKLYADPQLIKYLHDQDPMHLRAKQSMFVSWLFGPPNVPYTGKSVRIAHLRIIKQRGFSPEDFDLGMKYFEEAMTELGAPEVLRGEVMRRMMPYKDAIFTPAAGDAAEEARWAAEAAAEAARAESPHNGSHAASAVGSKTPSSALHAASANLNGLAAAPDAAVVAAPVAVAGGSRPGSRQCPFTGGRLSRPASAAVAPTAAAAIAAAQAAAGPNESAAVSAGLYPPVPSADNAPVAVAAPVAAAAKPPSRVPSAAAPPDHSVSAMEAELAALGQAKPAGAAAAPSVLAAVVEEGAGAVVGEEESDLLGAELAALVAAEDKGAV